MLPPLFDVRLKEMMGIRIVEIAKEAKEEFSKTSAESAAKGLSHSGYTYTLYQQTGVRQIEKRVASVRESQKKLLSTLQVPYSEGLAQELKAMVESYVPESWCVSLLDSYPVMTVTTADKLKQQFREELLQIRSSALRKAFLDVDLVVDDLRTQVDRITQQEPREQDQKFKILFSPGQAIKDFGQWVCELGTLGSQIAVIFIDLDNFKALNTKYTEPRIDNCLLPEAMRLVESLTRTRGGAYKHGGDEYVIILPNHDLDEAVNFAEKVRRAFAQHEFKVNGDTVQLTFSAGVALWPDHGSTYEEVLTNASAAKQIAKAERNCVRPA